MNYSREIFLAFKRRGLTVQASASKQLLGYLETDPENFVHNLTAVLDEIQSRIEKRIISTTMVDSDAMLAIIADLSADAEDTITESTQVISAFKTPKLEFDEKTKSYVVINNVRAEMHSTAETRAHMFRQRYLQIQQRLLRSGKFVLRGMASTTKTGQQNMAETDRKIEISSIESLLGTGVGTNRLLLAFITQPDEEGQWYLEDLSTSIIKVDLSQLVNEPRNSSRVSPDAACHNINKMFIEGNVVLVEGTMAKNKMVFQAQSLCYPAAEERSTTMRALGQNGMCSLWCGGDPVASSGGMNRPQYWEELQALEERDEGQMIVTLSDIELDKPHVMEKLQVLFSTYEATFVDSVSSVAGDGGAAGAIDLSQAPVFILVGPFIVQTDILSYQGREVALHCWDSLAKLLINSCPVLLTVSKFIFVPSSKDVYCTGGNAAPMPHFPISALFTDSFVRQLHAHIVHTRDSLGLDSGNHAGNDGSLAPENIVFTSNPTRVHYYSQELLVFQEDFLRRLQKHAHFFPSAGVKVRADSNIHNGSMHDDDMAMNVSMDADADADADAESSVDNMHQGVHDDGSSSNHDNIDDSALTGSARLILQCILDQGHLSPLSLTHNLSPLVWSLDHAMSLSPLPHLLILADHGASFEYEHKGCKVVNPGSFATDFSFLVYYPGQRLVQLSKIE